MQTAEPTLTDDINDALDRYRPRPTHSPLVADVYPAARAHCIAAVQATEPRASGTAKARLSFLARYATWLVATGQWTPDNIRRMPITPTLIDGFTASPLCDDATTYRSQLSGIGRAYLPELWAPDNPFADGGYGPYLPVELDLLWNGASRARHDDNERTVATVIAATAGAGLTGDDYRVVRAQHVVMDQDNHVYVMVQGNGRDRCVPVAGTWATRLHALRDAYQPDELLTGGFEPVAQPVNTVAQRARRAGLAHFSLRRLRSRWLLDRLQDGVPTDTLMRYGAVQSATTFDRLVPYLRARNTEMELALMRGQLRRR